MKSELQTTSGVTGGRWQSIWTAAASLHIVQSKLLKAGDTTDLINGATAAFYSHDHVNNLKKKWVG